MKTSKILLLVLVLALALAVFAACAQKPVEPTGDTDKPLPTTAEILANKNFRLALNYALDREQYIAITSAGLYKPATRFVLPAVAGTGDGQYCEQYPVDVYQPTADLEKAQEHLTLAMEELGLTDPSQISIKLKISDTATSKLIVENCQDQWMNNLGIDVKIEIVTYKVMLSDRTESNFELIYAGWMPDYDDPYTYLNYFVSSNPQNGGKFSNARYDELVNTANTYADEATRLAMYQEAEQILMEEAGIIPLQVRQVPWAHDSNLKGLLRFYLGAEIDYSRAYFEGDHDQNLTFTQVEVPTLDPQLFNASPSYVCIKGYSEGLVRTYGNEINPGMADSWEIAEDNMSMTFHIRDGACWADGSPLTAQDFVYSFQRLANPATAANYSWVLYEIKNYAAIADGTMDYTELGVSAPDDQTFVIEFDTPAPYYLGFLDMPPFHPVKQELVEQYGAEYATSADKMLGNGPFKVQEYLPDNKLVLVPNENYWNKDIVKLDSVTILLMADEAAFAQLQSGDIDMCNIPVPQAPPYVSGETTIPGITVESYMSGAVDWFCINVSGK